MPQIVTLVATFCGRPLNSFWGFLFSSFLLISNFPIKIYAYTITKLILKKNKPRGHYQFGNFILKEKKFTLLLCPDISKILKLAKSCLSNI